MTTLAIPAMVNAHSHAFQRGLRGVAERPAPEAHARDDFWSWREAMFALAGALDPASMREQAELVYREMRDAGYGAVGEFHYVHHQADGTPYEDANAMAKAVAEAAEAAGLAIVLLPAAYHRNGWDGADRPPAGGQVRFCDPTVDAFLERVDALRDWADGRPRVSVGVAAHSIRAVPFAWLEAIAAYADEHRLVRHVHASEQRRELAECEAEHGCSPIALLDRAGFLGEHTSIVHGIHVSDADVDLLARSRTIVVTCPTTEGNLGDGFLPALRYRDAGVRLAVGTDSQARVDPFEEARELETLARREQEGRFALLAAAGDLWERLCADGRASLGIGEDVAGQATIDVDHPQIAGVPAADLRRALVMSGSAAVVVGPEPPATAAGRH
jgi:formimidoylglutamate deiminase